MGRTSGRGPDETRAMILRAAGQLFLEHGTAATLEQIAARAGVSKGGLKYHFSSKDDLVTTLAALLVQEFRDRVVAQIDPDEPEPGRLVRAYVRVCVDPDVDGAQARERLTLEALLGTQPSVQEVLAQDSRWWEDALSADGLPEGLRDVVVAAADGASALLWGHVCAAERVVALRDALLAMAAARA